MQDDTCKGLRTSPAAALAGVPRHPVAVPAAARLAPAPTLHPQPQPPCLTHAADAAMTKGRNSEEAQLSIVQHHHMQEAPLAGLIVTAHKHLSAAVQAAGGRYGRVLRLPWRGRTRRWTEVRRGAGAERRRQ